MPHPKLTISGLTVRAVHVPMRRAHKTSSGTIAVCPLALIDLQTAEGVVGHSYVFSYTPVALLPLVQLIRNLEPWLKGEAVAPTALGQGLERRFRLLGPQGLTGIAMGGIDMAAWDALARADGKPLATVLGGKPCTLPAYSSEGMSNPDEATREAEALCAAGFRNLKFKIGHPDVATDIAVIKSARRAVGDHIGIIVDYNQSLSVPEAIRRCQQLDDLGLLWIEEPTVAHDFVGHAQIAAAVQTPIQIGENWWGPADMEKSIAAGASDLAMPDVMKIGGVTGWMRAVELANQHRLPISSHIFCEFSSHLLAVTPTCQFLEYNDWADPVVREPVVVRDGQIVVADRPGAGLEWDEDAVKKYQVG
jgi:mandelate racemase